MNISSAIFDRSAPDLDSCPDESLPEFAFIGRSNVGKSSLLNMLVGQDGLARVSPMPGFTKLINIFKINRTWRLVDLPGYGFAQVAREDSARFNAAVLDYLQHRKNLSCIFALIDSGLPPQKIDLEFVEWMTGHGLPFVFVFTKTDSNKPADVEANIAAFMERIAAWYQQPPATLMCSAATGAGRQELLDLIAKSLAEMEKQPSEPPPPPKAAASLPEDLPPPGWPVRATASRSHKRVKGPRPW